jgi:hypothetical protein
MLWIQITVVSKFSRVPCTVLGKNWIIYWLFQSSSLHATESKDVLIVACYVAGLVEGQGPAIYVGHCTKNSVEMLIVEGALAHKEANSSSVTNTDTASEGWVS